jgi:hypothetical protein
MLTSIHQGHRLTGQIFLHPSFNDLFILKYYEVYLKA